MSHGGDNEEACVMSTRVLTSEQRCRQLNMKHHTSFCKRENRERTRKLRERYETSSQRTCEGVGMKTVEIAHDILILTYIQSSGTPLILSLGTSQVPFTGVFQQDLISSENCSYQESRKTTQSWPNFSQQEVAAVKNPEPSCG